MASRRRSLLDFVVCGTIARSAFRGPRCARASRTGVEKREARSEKRQIFSHCRPQAGASPLPHFTEVKGCYMRTAVWVLLWVGLFGLVARAEITVGIIVGATGPGAAIGIPSKNALSLAPKVIAGENVRYIVLDDGGDTTNAVTDARRLITEEHVDLIIGSSSIPTATAVSYAAAETKTPQIALSPLAASNRWSFQVAQPMSVLLGPIVDNLKKRGAHTLAFLGFSDAFGDDAYQALTAHARRAGIQIVANERFARTDTSVTGQVLKIMAARPDAVLVAASATPAALPQITLVERGYRGPIYYVPTISQDFLRIAGTRAEGAITVASPGSVPEQLPDSNPMKKVALRFNQSYEQAFGAGSSNQFAGYAYDAYLLLAHAVPSALQQAKPGTPEFRQALRDALESSRNVVGTSAIFNMSRVDHAGVDSRSVVLVSVQNGAFKLVP